MSALVPCAGLFGLAFGLLAADSRADGRRDDKVDLRVSDKAPAFEARSDADTTWESARHVGKKWIVIYFYPGDFTPGCTAQANLYRDAMHKRAGKGVEVIGVSGDSVQWHIPLLSLALGVIGAGRPAVAAEPLPLRVLYVGSDGERGGRLRGLPQTALRQGDCGQS